MSEPQQAKKRSIVKLGIRLLGPVILVLVLYKARNATKVLSALSADSILPIGGAMLLNALNYAFKVLRGDVLLEARGYRYSRARAYGSFLSSSYLGLLTPGRVGDVLRAQYLRHDLGMPYSEGLAFIVVDRLCDVYVLLAFVAVGISRFSAALVGDLAIIAWAGVALTALGPLLLFVPQIAEPVTRLIYKKLPGAAAFGGFEVFLAALKKQSPGKLVIAVLWTTLAFGVNYAQGYLVAGALHLDISLFDVVCLLAVASLLGLLPISVSGVGVRELFFSLVFPLLGLPKDAGVVYGLGVFFVIYLASVAMGFVSWHVAPPPVSAGDAAPKT